MPHAVWHGEQEMKEGRKAERGLRQPDGEGLRNALASMLIGLDAAKRGGNVCGALQLSCIVGFDGQHAGAAPGYFLIFQSFVWIVMRGRGGGGARGRGRRS